MLRTPLITQPINNRVGKSGKRFRITEMYPVLPDRPAALLRPKGLTKPGACAAAAV